MDRSTTAFAGVATGDSRAADARCGKGLPSALNLKYQLLLLLARDGIQTDVGVSGIITIEVGGGTIRLPLITVVRATMKRASVNKPSVPSE